MSLKGSYLLDSENDLGICFELCSNSARFAEDIRGIRPYETSSWRAAIGYVMVMYMVSKQSSRFVEE